MMRYPTILLAFLCVACGSYSANVPTIKPYKMDIQQGNVVTPKMMMQLRPGMTKSQVRFLMGTPLLVDSFHTDRWDYFYQMRKDGKIIEQRRIILDFDGDNLAHVRGDVIPAGTAPSATPAAGTSKAPRPVIKPAAKEKGLLDSLKFWGDDETEKKNTPTEQAKPAPAKPAIKQEAPTTETKAAPAQTTEEQPKPQVVKEEAAKPAKQEEKPSEDKKGWLDKLKFWGDDEKAPAKAAPVAKPTAPAKAETPKTEPVREETKAAAKPVVATEPPPAPRRPSQPEATPKAAPKPAVELPAEDAPDYFEKMLEKIGF